MILLNGNPVNITRFPDNTSQVWQLDETILKETNYMHITWEFANEGEFMQIAQLKLLLDAETDSTVTLRIKYLPYGRQDKEIANGLTFALRPFALLLNALKFDEVIIHDPHSSVALEAIDNSKAVFPTDELGKAILVTKSNCICYPDNGAMDKYSKVLDYNLFSWPIIRGEKVRDQLTGHITSYQIFVENQSLVYLPDTKVMIVDDICDGGATFVLLAQKLLNDIKVQEVNLFVTHGLFTKGLQTLKDAGINRIFTQKGEVLEYDNNITYLKDNKQ